MRPIRLEMKGFSAFREETIIDFATSNCSRLLGQPDPARAA